MTNLNVTLLHEKTRLPDMAGPAVVLRVLDARLDSTLIPGEKPVQAYWIHTGLAFAVPDGHVLKIYPAPELAQRHLARLAECVAVVLPGDDSEVKLRLVVDRGCKSFEPVPNMVVAYGLLEAVITPVLMGVDQGSPEGDKNVVQTVVPASEEVVPASENLAPAKDTSRAKKGK